MNIHANIGLNVAGNGERTFSCIHASETKLWKGMLKGCSVKQRGRRRPIRRLVKNGFILAIV